MNKKKFTKLLALYLPYLVIGLAATNLGEAWRLAEGKELGDKIVSLMGTLPAAFANPLPSLHPLDILVGICCGAGLRLAVYLKSKNAKKYRHGMEYGSARWGTPADIAPFMAPKFEDNIILTKTERLMMSNRPPDPKNARNKNVLVVGGSGSGKTRYFIKPNLLQCTSKSHPVSFVVTDPKGGLIQECGLALLKNGYKIRTMNTINFHKSMMLLGTYRGFELNIRFDSFKNEHQIVLRGELSYPVPLGDDPRGNIVRLDNAIGNFADRIADADAALDSLEQQKQAAEVEIAKPFAQEEELQTKSARLAELDALLNMEHQSSRTEPEAEEKPDARPSVLAALEEKADKVEPVRPFKSYLDKDGDAR